MRQEELEILLRRYKLLDADATMTILKKKLENMRTTNRELKKVSNNKRRIVFYKLSIIVHGHLIQYLVSFLFVCSVINIFKAGYRYTYIFVSM